VLRIVTGALIGLSALPVVFTLLKTRKPELGTPQLALTLRTSSVGLHVLAGVLIIGTAISENWFDLDSAGRWLFGIYGAAAAIALLGIAAFYLAYVAELPPPPPKPLKPKAEKKQRRRRRKAADDAESGATEETTESADEAQDEAEADDGEPSEAEAPAESEEPAEEPAEVKAETPEDDTDASESKPEAATSDEVNGAESANGGLRNRRTPGRISLRKRRRSRGGVALDG
jgi:hypothetical protein